MAQLITIPVKHENIFILRPCSRQPVFFCPNGSEGNPIPLPHRTDLPHLEQGFRQMGVGQSGANTTRVVVDIVTIDIDVTIIVDIRGIVTVVAGRPKPPPARPYNQIPRITPLTQSSVSFCFRTVIAFYRCLSKRRASTDNP